MKVANSHRASVGPIIVLGVHRSGTSVVAQLLEGLGVFMGARKDIHSEAVFFKSLNRFIFQQAGASWDRPEPMLELLEDKEAMAVVRGALREQLSGPRRAVYMGAARFLFSRDLFAMNTNWGWKDPRTVFTLPVWHGLFPNARLVVVRRSPGPIARSLMRRRQASIEWWRHRPRWRRLWHRLFGYRDRLFDSSRTGSELECKKLVAVYVDQLERVVAAHRSQLSAIVAYEQLVADPTDTIRGLGAGIGLEPTEDRLRSLAQMIRVNT